MTSIPSRKLLETADIQTRLKKLKMLILDVDGVLTDGRIFWLENHGWTRFFHIKDGYGLKLLMKSGFDIGIISGGDSKDVRTRIEFLKIKHAYFGDEDKIIAYERIKKDTGYTDEQIAFMGDELFDISVLEKVGFSATVPHAVDAVQKRVHYVTESAGGAGAVREVVDAIRKAQGIGPYSDD